MESKDRDAGIGNIDREPHIGLGDEVDLERKGVDVRREMFAMFLVTCFRSKPFYMVPGSIEQEALWLADRIIEYLSDMTPAGKILKTNKSLGDIHASK